MNTLKEIALEKLKTAFGIDYKWHTVYPSLVLLKYNQLECSFTNPEVCECRGLILDSAEDWRVVAYPFNKFQNESHPLADKIDWKTARVQEKLDGSIISIYYYFKAREWQISTSGCPDGFNQIDDSGITFRDLVLDCLDKQGLQRQYWDPYFTYIFELTSPLNRVVVDHKEAKLTLIGVRSNVNFCEIATNDLERLRLCFNNNLPPIVQEYSLSDLDSCLKAAEKLNPLEHEGYVVVDADFNRVKIKSPAYVAIHHIKDSCSLSKMALVVRNGEYEEFLIALDSYPMHKARFLEIVERYKTLINTCVDTYSSIKDISNQKEFALLACQSEFNTVLFSMRKTGKSVQQVLHDMLENTFLRLMGIK
jgi:hypothetical protein